MSKLRIPEIGYFDSDLSVEKHIKKCHVKLKEMKRQFLKRYYAPLIPKFCKDNFIFLRCLGFGAHGRIYSAKHAETNEIYAIKVLEKKLIINNNQLHHFKEEVSVLNSVRFRFNSHIEFFFVDNVYIYLGMPYYRGGTDLFDHIKITGGFSEDVVKFYACQVVLALEYLHYCGLIYRDLKPENIILENNGYIKIIDYGFSKLIETHRTYTFCGTDEYMAPEIILAKGYGVSVDWWAFGVLIYELTTGYSPFSKRNIGEAKMYDAIISCQYACPSKISPTQKDLISRLLIFDPMKRYGGLKNRADDVKTHEWLRKNHWESIYYRKVTPTYIPRISPSMSNMQNNSEDYIIFRTSKHNEHAKEFQWLTSGAGR